MNSKKNSILIALMICTVGALGFGLKKVSDEQQVEKDLVDFATRAHEREIKEEQERLKTSIEVEQAKRELKDKEEKELAQKAQENQTALAEAKTFLAEPKEFFRKNMPYKGVTANLYCRFVDGRINYTLRFLGTPATLEYVTDRMEEFELNALDKQGNKVFGTMFDIKQFRPTKNKSGAIFSLDSGNQYWISDVGEYLSIHSFQVRY